MTSHHLIPNFGLATRILSVALELRIKDFRRVSRTPRSVIGGLIHGQPPRACRTWDSPAANEDLLTHLAKSAQHLLGRDRL